MNKLPTALVVGVKVLFAHFGVCECCFNLLRASYCFRVLFLTESRFASAFKGLIFLDGVWMERLHVRQVWVFFWVGTGGKYKGIVVNVEVSS